MTNDQETCMRVLFVCLGNICRSPTAEGVVRQRLEQHGGIVGHRVIHCEDL